MWPPPSLWLTITDQCWPGVLKLQRKECPGSKDAVYPKFRKELFLQEIYGTMPYMRGVGLRNGTFGRFSPKQRGSQNHFSTAGPRQRHKLGLNRPLKAWPLFWPLLLACLYLMAMPALSTWAANPPTPVDRPVAAKPEPQTAPDYVKVGREARDRDRQIRYFSKAIELDPNCMEAFFWRGIAYEALKENDKALADFNRTIDLNPKRAANYIWRAIALANQGDYDRALADLNQALVLEPRYGWAYFHRGRVRALRGQLDQALGDLDWAVIIDPFDSPAFLERGKIHLKKKAYDIAVADFSKSIGSDSKNYLAYYFRAQAYQALGETAKAQADSDKYHELKP